MNLYEIEQGILECVDLESGEIIDAERLDELQMEKGEKIKNLALWCKNLRHDIEGCKGQEKYFAERRRTAENKLESIESYLSGFLNGEKYKFDNCEIRWRESTATEITDESAIPSQYIVSGEPTIDKTAIKNDIKAGVKVPGAALVTKNNIQIK